MDQARWTQNKDGSWSRTNAAGSEERSYATNPNVEATAGAVEAADELGVDLASVEGTGKGGKVTKADVEAATA